MSGEQEKPRISQTINFADRDYYLAIFENGVYEVHASLQGNKFEKLYSWQGIAGKSLLRAWFNSTNKAVVFQYDGETCEIVLLKWNAPNDSNPTVFTLDDPEFNKDVDRIIISEADNRVYILHRYHAEEG